MAKIPIGDQIAMSLPAANIDARYGPYESKQEVMDALGENGMDVIAEGITVGIIENNEIVEYWFHEGTDIDHLIKKVDLNPIYQQLRNHEARITINTENIDTIRWR